jgi:nitrile hydratase accessory protein
VTTAVVALDLEGPAAPPRSNGELVFAEPWESRIFGVTVSMHQDGRFEWPAFQAELIAAIARWEAEHGEDEAFSYYTCWLQGIEALLAEMGVVEPAQLRARVESLEARPDGHDHDHGHELGHDHG